MNEDLAKSINWLSKNKFGQIEKPEYDHSPYDLIYEKKSNDVTVSVYHFPNEDGQRIWLAMIDFHKCNLSSARASTAEEAFKSAKGKAILDLNKLVEHINAI